MRKIKILSIMLMYIIMTLLVSVCSAGTSPRATERDAEEIVTKAYQNFHNLQNYHMTIDAVTSFTSQGHNLNVVTQSDCDVQVRPMLLKNTTTITMTMDTAAQKVEQKIEQYVEEAGDACIIYSNFNNQWVKQYGPKYSLLNENDNYFKAMTRVKTIRETAVVKVCEVTVDGRYLKENMERVMAAAGMQKIKLTDDLFKDMEDITYTITIDKKLSAISKMEVDLSRLIASIGKNLTTSSEMPAEQKSILRGMLDSVKYVATMTFSQFDYVGKISIPEEVKNQSNIRTIPSLAGNRQRNLPKLLSPASIVYPPLARLNNWQGKVFLRIAVSDQGTVENATVIESSGYQVLDDAALSSVKNLRFSPAQENGKAIASYAILPVSYSLQDDISITSSEAIKNIQQKLNELGFDCGEPDGIMGPKTEQAIKDFQQAKGLEPDGIVGPETKKALGI